MTSTAINDAIAPPNEWPVIKTFDLGYFYLSVLVQLIISLDIAVYVSQNPRWTAQSLQSPNSYLKNFTLLIQLVKSYVPNLI